MSKKPKLRRSNGEGTFYRKKDKWRGQFSTMKNGKLIRRTFTGDTKLEVYHKGQQWLEVTQHNTFAFSAQNSTLTQLATYWLESIKQISVKPKTYQKYVSSLHLYVLPYLGTYKVSTITPQDIQELLNQWSTGVLKGKKGHVISSSTIRCARRYLSELLNYAVNIGLLFKNPCKLTKPPRLKTNEIHPLSIEEIYKLTSTMKAQLQEHIDSPYRMNYYASYIAVKLAIGTGMRLGEVFGLCWDCVNLEKDIISIRRTIQTGSKEKTFQDTKTKTSRRSIPISQELHNDLEKFRYFQKQYAQELGSQWLDNHDIVISGCFGNILSTSNFKSRYFIPVLKQIGLDHITFHDLRHTHATLLLSQKINPKIVQERLGHSTITLTLDTYSHLVPDIQKEAVKALNNLGI
ncbi:site-specific integrase [Veillonella sp.]|uniref:site-specific integrase n=1 Tax=Veillonella sp. TaxID=1926307 RepID=UPI0025D5C02E|nr:site-specific integrase [Veillonella sp.]